MCPDGNWTGDPLVHKLVLNPLSHTSWAINVFWWTEVLQFTEVLFFNFFLFYGESLIVSYLINLYLFQSNEDILLFSYRICIVLTFTFISTIHLQLRSIRYRSKLLLDTYPIDPALFIEGGGVPCPHFCGILWFCVKKKKRRRESPGWCGSVNWVQACEPKGHQFNSHQGTYLGYGLGPQ